MTNANEVTHPEIRDKWEARIASSGLQEQIRWLEDIQSQRDATKAEIAKLAEKLGMHERDLAYVAQIIASKLPACVVEQARRETQGPRLEGK